MDAKFMKQAVPVTILSVGLMLAAQGCDSPFGQAVGKVVTINNQPANEFFKGVIAQLNAQQKANLQAQSPQTLQTLEHNDQVQAQSSSEATIPLKADDITAMAAAGVKPAAIIDAVRISKSKFSDTDIAALRQANVDSAVLEYIKNNAASSPQ